MTKKYLATTLIGIRVRSELLFEVQIIPGCTHRIPALAKFCPECATPIDRSKKQPIQGYDAKQGRFNSLYVIHDRPNDKAIIGRPIGEATEDNPSDYFGDCGDTEVFQLLLDEVHEDLKGSRFLVGNKANNDFSDADDEAFDASDSNGITPDGRCIVWVCPQTVLEITEEP